jgi:hypothetical protein
MTSSALVIHAIVATMFGIAAAALATSREGRSSTPDRARTAGRRAGATVGVLFFVGFVFNDLVWL